MSFFSPSAAWLFLLALPLIALYFLKLKRPQVTVPSLVLWRRVLDDQRVNAPFQRFKRNLLLLLQLLLLALLILAAMQPFIRGSDDRVSRLPVLIDCSASMAAVERRGGKTRLDLAKERVNDLIAGLLPDQELAIISFSDTARQRCGFTSDRQRLRNALEAIVVEEVPSSVEHGVRMVQALGRGAPFEEVMLLTDGNVPDRAALDLPFRIQFQKIASPAPNIGITACRARRDREGAWEIFVEVVGSKEAELSGALLMRLANAAEDEPLASEIVTAKPGRAARLLFQVSAHERRDLEFELIPNAPVDALTSDNVAAIQLPPLRPLAIHASESLGALRHALQSIEDVNLFPGPNVSPDQFDLVITDGPADEAAPMRVRFNQIPEDLQELVTMGEPSPHQAIDWRRDAPLFQHVDFSNVVFLDEPIAQDLQEGTFVNRGYDILLHGQRGPLLVEKREEHALDLYAFFHPERSTFPYRVGFPVFVANLVEIARQRAGLSEAEALATGILPGFALGLRNQTVEVTLPGEGGRVSLTSDPSGYVPGLSARRVGRYRYDKGPGEVSASLLSAAETTLTQVESIAFREARVRAADETIETDRPLWHWLAAFGLMVLIIEWWAFQRRPGGWRASRMSS